VVSGEVVSFTTTLGHLDPAIGTAITNASGIATIRLTAGTVKGAGVVSVVTTTGETDSIGFATEGDGALQEKTIALTISSPNVSASSPETLTATLLDKGVPVEGVLVEFYLNGTLAGLLSAEYAYTDVNGKATVQLSSDNEAGIGMVTASAVSSGDSSDDDYYGYAKVAFTAAGDGAVQDKTITLTLSSPNVSASSPETLTATLLDKGVPVEGVLIKFRLDGTLAGLLNVEYAYTDVNGKATVQLSSDNEAGIGMVTVSTVSSGDSSDDDYYGYAKVAFTAAGDGAVQDKTIALTISSPNVSASSPETLTATLLDKGVPVEGVLVEFYLNGTLAGLLSAEYAYTDVNGKATVQLSSDNEAGIGMVTASAVSSGDSSDDDYYGYAKVAFTAAGDGAVQDKTITLTLSSPNVSASSPETLTATLLDKGVPVEGVLIKFRLDGTLAGLLSAEYAYTDVNGKATVQLSSDNEAGIGMVTASAVSSGDSSDDDYYGYATVAFTAAGDGVGTGVNISLVLTDLNGNVVDQISSISSGKLTATVTGVTKAVIVTFETDIGSIPIPTSIAKEGNVYKATVDLLAGNSLGAGTVTASLVSGESEQLVFSIGASSLSMGYDINGDGYGIDDRGLIKLSSSSISAGATAGLTVQIWDVSDATNATLFETETVEVTFSSGCSGLTTPSALIDSPVATIGGIAQSTYLAQGCEGDDIVTATANAGGVILSATGTITVATPIAGSIEFVSATPENITLKGVGGIESSTVIFKVRDTNGNAVANKKVNFSLNTKVGEINISPESAMTDANGEVQTVVNSGTVSTSVRVRAELVDNASIFSQSKLLVISTGIPDQDSFTLSASTLNVEGWDKDDTEVTITARLADAFNNPVPDGTAVNFTTEGGAIEPSCTTENGVCTVIWVSQYPKPEGHILGDVINPVHLPETQNTMGQKYGGRVTILATAIGEESFPDLNGNGRFDAAEMIAFSGNDISGNPYDLKEAFVDHNEDGLYNPSEGSDVKQSGAVEIFTDFNNDGVFSTNDTKYNGSLCGDATNCSIDYKSVNVRGSLVLVMSGSTPYFNTTFPINGGSIDITGDGTASASVIIADLHNQPMPAGTTVTFDAAVGSIKGISSYIWPNFTKNGGSSFGVTVQGEKDKTISGPLTVTVTTPSGVVTTYTVATIDITPPITP